MVAFFSYLLKLATIFTTRPKPDKEANKMVFKVIPLATAEVMIALPATILQNRFFFFFKSLGTAFRIRGLVAVSIKGFQHFNRAL